jgi:hypothetical protein
MLASIHCRLPIWLGHISCRTALGLPLPERKGRNGNGFRDIRLSAEQYAVLSEKFRGR